MRFFLLQHFILLLCSRGLRAFSPSGCVVGMDTAETLIPKNCAQILSPRMQRRNARLRIRMGATANNENSRPDPSILVASKDAKTQQIVFCGAFVALAVGTLVCINLWDGPGAALAEYTLGNDGFNLLRTTIFPIIFGSIFAAVGVLHFVFKDNFAQITPPRGTWGGLWQAPSPFAEQLGVTYEEYHTYWTGIAEFVGGLWLLAGGLGWTDVHLPAALLFALTVAVTPANLYMFTHDATPGGSIPRLPYPEGHLARFVVQCGLLSNFFIVATV